MTTKINTIVSSTRPSKDNIKQTENGPLKFIIAGYERGGTTLVNEVFRNHPDLNSGFESGLLLAKDPGEFRESEFNEYNNSLIKNGWGITDEQLHEITSTENFEEAYSLLKEFSSVIFDKKVEIFDKTPKYLQKLDLVLGRINTKAIIIIRNPKSVFYSWFKRTGKPTDEDTVDEFIKSSAERYISYARGYKRASALFRDRIMLATYEDLIMKPVDNFSRLFAFVDLNFEKKYLSVNSKYAVHGNEISTDYLFEYKKHFTDYQINLIQKLTEEARFIYGLSQDWKPVQ